MKVSPVKGTRDFLPAEAALRDYVQNKILSVYKSSGFSRIYTPIIEEAENLNNSDGGDNLKLIFKILKRGDKLQKCLDSGSANEESLSDMGLRYDLTLPLSRFYAANRERLPNPFKVIQTDRVYRAERPQKMRSREFVQCDIDIIGDSSTNAEIELIDVTGRALNEVGFKNATILINDRRVLSGMLFAFGFEKDTLGSVCITFDKLDKIGVDGIAAELAAKNMPQDAVEKLIAFLNKESFTLATVSELLSEDDRAFADDLKRIIDTVASVSDGIYSIEYSPRLVRGQGYYTGVVFEVNVPGYAGAVGGGGRYDNMIGKFLNTTVPAVGFSIGFERIITILLEQNFVPPTQAERIVLLYGKDEDFKSVMQKAKTLRGSYDTCVAPLAKKVGKQLERLAFDGYNQVCFSDKFPEIKQLDGAKE